MDISTVRRFAPADSTLVPVPVRLTKLLAQALALAQAQVQVRVNFAPAPAQAHVAGGCRRSCRRLHRPRRLFVYNRIQSATIRQVDQTNVSEIARENYGS